MPCPGQQGFTNQISSSASFDFSLAGNPAEAVAACCRSRPWKSLATKFQVVEFVGCVAVDKTPTASCPEEISNIIRAASMSVMERLCFPVFPPHGTGRSTGRSDRSKERSRAWRTSLLLSRLAEGLARGLQAWRAPVLPKETGPPGVRHYLEFVCKPDQFPALLDHKHRRAAGEVYEFLPATKPRRRPMPQNSDNHIALFIRDEKTGRYTFNPKALKVLGIDPRSSARKRLPT